MPKKSNIEVRGLTELIARVEKFKNIPKDLKRMVELILAHEYLTIIHRILQKQGYNGEKWKRKSRATKLKYIEMGIYDYDTLWKRTGELVSNIKYKVVDGVVKVGIIRDGKVQDVGEEEIYKVALHNEYGTFSKSGHERIPARPLFRPAAIELKDYLRSQKSKRDFARAVTLYLKSIGFKSVPTQKELMHIVSSILGGQHNFGEMFEQAAASYANETSTRSSL